MDTVGDGVDGGVIVLGIGENIASGNYSTYAPGVTNSAAAVVPIVPK